MSAYDQAALSNEDIGYACGFDDAKRGDPPEYMRPKAKFSSWKSTLHTTQSAYESAYIAGYEAGNRESH